MISQGNGSVQPMPNDVEMNLKRFNKGEFYLRFHWSPGHQKEELITVPNKFAIMF